MSVESLVPVVPSADLETSLVLWTEGLSFEVLDTVERGGRLVWCMLGGPAGKIMLNIGMVLPKRLRGMRESGCTGNPRTSKRSTAGCEGWASHQGRSSNASTGGGSSCSTTRTGTTTASECRANRAATEPKVLPMVRDEA